MDGYQTYTYNPFEEVDGKPNKVNLDNHYGDKKFSLLEKITVGIGVVVLIVALTFGFINQSTKNRDLQRVEDISEILLALDQFFINSNLIPSQRNYPIAECSEKLNEVDYEFTLRQYLTGQREKANPHPFLSNSNYPSDPWGQYAVEKTQRKSPLRDCPKVFSDLNTRNQVYNDSFRSCEFEKTDSNFKKCYLYTSSNNGDSFQLAYYSEANGLYVIYSKLLNSKLTITTAQI